MAHILVVEDEAHLAQGIKYNLEAEGYSVTTASTGPAALQLIQDGAPPADLVILDIMLPGMSGYSVCEQLRASGNQIPVLILSARTLTEDRIRGFDIGADQYLTKPFELDELLALVKSLLTRRRQLLSPQPVSPTARTLRIGSADVDLDAFQARIGEQIVPLTPMEIKLLEYFVRHEGRVIPRRELLEKVWDQPGFLQTRAPDQFIRRLRKIFETDPSQPRHFRTIRDGGYRFVAQPQRD